MAVRRAKESHLAKSPEHSLHLARHVHFEDHGLRRDAGFHTQCEGAHHGHTNHRTHRLFDEQIEIGLSLRVEFQGASLEDAHCLSDT